MESDRNESGEGKTGAGVPLKGEAAKHIGGAARDSQGGKDAGTDEGIAAEVSRLAAKVDSLMKERVTPALAEATEAVAEQAGRAATAAKDHPFFVAGLLVVAGFLIGRFTAPPPPPSYYLPRAVQRYLPR